MSFIRKWLIEHSRYQTTIDQLGSIPAGEDLRMAEIRECWKEISKGINIKCNLEEITKYSKEIVEKKSKI